MNERLNSLMQRYNELSLLIQDPDLTKDQNRYRSIMKEYSQLSEIASLHTEITGLTQQLEEAKTIAQEEKDLQMRELAKEELKELETRLQDSGDKLKLLLIPKDPLD